LAPIDVGGWRVERARFVPPGVALRRARRFWRGSRRLSRDRRRIVRRRIARLRIDILRVAAACAEDGERFLDRHAIEHQLGFTHLAALFQIPPQLFSSVH
jgi:hypothetical protein